MRRTLGRLAAQYQAPLDLPPLIRIANGTFYRQHPSSQSVPHEDTADESAAKVDTNPPLFPGLDFTTPSFSEPKQHWSILSKDSAVRTTFLHVLRGQHICLPPTARSYPYLATDSIADKDPRLRSPSHAIQYVGFDAERGAAGGSGMRGAYMSARYESRKEETDFSLRDYLFGNTELNADETLARHPDQALVDQIMVDLKLEALESMPVTNLSNGQTRRARIAKALLAKPELLLLDGPFMGLDPPTVRLLTSILQRLAEAHAPRLILSLNPDEDFPSWITHTAYLNSNFTVDSLGPRKDIIGNLHQRARTIWQQALSLNDMSQEQVHLVQVSNLLRGKEPGFVSGTRADSRLYVRAHARNQRRLDLGTVIRSRDGFGPNPAPVPPPGEALVEMKGVNVKYGDKSVLGDWKQEFEGKARNGLWWNICRGQRWGVFGPNGSGKTTLISLITSDHPQTYSLPITIFGRSRLPQVGQPGISIFDIQSRIGHSSPEVHVFFPKYLSVRRTIESAWADTPLTKPKTSWAIDEKVTAALIWFRSELNPSLGPSDSEKFETLRRAYQDRQQQWQIEEMKRILFVEEETSDLVDWADDMKFGELSFSAQRVALFIRAVIRNPDLVILDEAFSGMDDAARDKCHLFLSRGQSASFRLRSKDNRNTLRQSGPTVQESFHSRLGRVKVHGLQDHQALIVISHKKEEVPGCVRDWICLPEPGQGPPRTGQLPQPLELYLHGWDEIWGTRVMPLRTASSEGWPKRERPGKYSRGHYERWKARESLDARAQRLARQREYMRLRRASETPEQKEKRLADVAARRQALYNRETAEEREQRMEQDRKGRRDRWCRVSPETRLKRNQERAEKSKRRYYLLKTQMPVEALMEKWRKTSQRFREKETPEQKEQRKAKLRKRYAERVASQTPEEREVRKEWLRLRAREAIAKETLEQRENRLERVRRSQKKAREKRRQEKSESREEKSTLRVRETTIKLLPEQREKREKRLEKLRVNSREWRKKRRQEKEANAKEDAEVAEGKALKEKHGNEKKDAEAMVLQRQKREGEEMNRQESDHADKR